MPGATSAHAPEAAAFNPLAEVYDDLFTETHVGRAQRAIVWREIDKFFRPGQHILEINCGTGVDAIHLARQGMHVLACDVSTKMIEVARSRLQREAVRPSVEFRVLPTESLAILSGEGPFDGALSNFAGLNCVEDLSAVGSSLARLLKPGAKFVVCVFGRWCLWEILWHLARGNVNKAFRRLRAKPFLTNLSAEANVEVRYPSVLNLKHTFAPYFRLEKLQGLGIAVPPSYLEPLAARHARAFRLAASFDRRFSHIPFVRALADHALLTFERTG